MRGETILNAYSKAMFRYGMGPEKWRLFQQRQAFRAEVARRLAAYDAAMGARVAERFMSQAMASAVTDYDFFTAVVNRINMDSARIAELEAKYAKRTKEFIEWIDYISSVSSGTSQDYRKARRKMEQLEKEIAEASK